jgi:hypothetical protein
LVLSLATLAPGVNARDTADCETPASRATSMDVTLRRAIRSGLTLCHGTSPPLGEMMELKSPQQI